MTQKIPQGFARKFGSTSASLSSPLQVVASCLPGLEGFLSQELSDLGFQTTKRTKGGVHFQASGASELYKCHLWCGTASNIYLQATTEDKPIRARGMAELKKHVSRLTFWENYIMNDNGSVDLPSALEIRVKSSKSKLYHTKGIAERVEEGIYTSLGKSPPKNMDDGNLAKGQQRDSNIPKIKVLVKIYRDQVEILVDTSSTPIHQRGYRLETGKAPLREDLAFALLYSTKRFARNAKNHCSLLDPFCGSGTIPIEAAAMAHNLPPGRLRKAPLQGLTLYDPDCWKGMVESSIRNSTVHDTDDDRKNNIQILGTDRNKGAIGISQRNAIRAGVDHLVTFHHQAISSNAWFENPSVAPNRLLVACNPPFGHRVSKNAKQKDPNKSLLPLIQTLGHKVMALPEYNNREVAVNILTNNQNLIRRSGIPNLKASFATNHGGMKVFSVSSTL